MNKTITILGSTGSIGIQTLDVISKSNGKFKVNYLTTNFNISLLEDQIKKFSPNGVVIADEISYYQFKERTKFKGNILFGKEGIIEASSDPLNDIIVSSLVGFSGVLPTLAAIKQSKTIALANKETLVSAGKIIIENAKKYNAKIIAVDSEHNAILQCIIGEDVSSIEKIILTASGGSFRDLPIEKFNDITVEQALKHPNWNMGNKITIDSATMMNKGFEVIEARWLFDLKLDQIEVIIHPQSIIHSLVQFVDGSIKAQLGMPDMRIPISYSITYPERFYYDFPRLDLLKIKKFDFYEPDYNRYPALKLAYEVLEKDGNYPCVLNAANEICVYSFLNNEIKFTQIAQIIEQILTKISYIKEPNLDEIIETDNETRIITKELIKNIGKNGNYI